MTHRAEIMERSPNGISITCTCGDRFVAPSRRLVKRIHMAHSNEKHREHKTVRNRLVTGPESSAKSPVDSGEPVPLHRMAAERKLRSDDTD